MAVRPCSGHTASHVPPISRSKSVSVTQRPFARTVLPLAAAAILSGTVALFSPAPPLLAQGAARPAAKASAPAQAQALAPAWTVDARQSSIGYATRWAGQAVTGSFGSWTADVRFDPANLAGSRVVVVVQTGSSRANLAEANDNLPLADWLNVRGFPTARWESTGFRQTAPGQYVGDGFLTLKGQRYRLALPFTLAISGTTATMTSSPSLDRLNLRVGVDSDSSAEWVDRAVQLSIRVRATRQ
jgi:polyisoprenoid-binding protein YceI